MEPPSSVRVLCALCLLLLVPPVVAHRGRRIDPEALAPPTQAIPSRALGPPPEHPAKGGAGLDVGSRAAQALRLVGDDALPVCGTGPGVVDIKPSLSLQPDGSADDYIARDEDAFDSIYRNKVWGDGPTLSGSGSDLPSTRILCRTIAQAVLEAAAEKQAAVGRDVTVSLLDAPSGDFYWMPHCLRAIEHLLPLGVSLVYQGVDVSSVAVSLAQKRRANATGGPFRLGRTSVQPFQVMDLAKPDALTDAFPGSRFDVINCHDALQHNPLSNIDRIIHNFNAAGRRLVLDVDRAGDNARDIGVGDFRPYDITQPPYHAKPECIVRNTGGIEGRPGSGEWENFGIFKLPITTSR